MIKNISRIEIVTENVEVLKLKREDFGIIDFDINNVKIDNNLEFSCNSFILEVKENKRVKTQYGHGGFYMLFDRLKANDIVQIELYDEFDSQEIYQIEWTSIHLNYDENQFSILDNDQNNLLIGSNRSKYAKEIKEFKGER